MSRPTIASLTANLAQQIEYREAAEAKTRAVQGELDAQKKVIEGLRGEIDTRDGYLAEAKGIAAYWLGRVHQAEGIPDEDKGRTVTELIATPRYSPDAWRYR